FAKVETCARPGNRRSSRLLQQTNSRNGTGVADPVPLIGYSAGARLRLPPVVEPNPSGSAREHTETAATRSDASRNGILTTSGATIALALGPSVIANLTVTAYITPIEQEFGWLRSDVSFAFSLVAYMIVVMSPLQGMLVDRFGPRRVVLTSIPLFAL